MYTYQLLESTHVYMVHVLFFFNIFCFFFLFVWQFFKKYPNDCMEPMHLWHSRSDLAFYKFLPFAIEIGSFSLFIIDIQQILFAYL